MRDTGLDKAIVGGRVTDAEKPISVVVAEARDDQRAAICYALASEGYGVLEATSGSALRTRLERRDADVVLSDVDLPGLAGLELLKLAGETGFDRPLILVSAEASIAQAVDLMRAGAFHYLAAPAGRSDLLDAVGSASEQVRQLRALNDDGPQNDPTVPIVFRSQTMARLLALARNVAESSASVLIQGPSGTGKELMARAIHTMSRRADGPFVVIDSTAIPETLLESELFGYRRGAFTGAVADKRGIIEQSDGGTLFLDEVGNLSPQVQAKLLRFLQERTYRRVGDVGERSVDTRLVSATNCDLKKAVADGAFREDLYYRLAVFTLDIPPLRERTQDIPALVHHFVRHHNRSSDYRVEGLSPNALQALVTHPWPGNVRQLENVVERAVILRRAGLIRLGDLPTDIAQSPTTNGDARSMVEIEREHILRLLKECGNNQSQVARILGISRRTVYRKLKDWGENPE